MSGREPVHADARPHREPKRPGSLISRPRTPCPRGRAPIATRVSSSTPRVMKRSSSVRAGRVSRGPRSGRRSARVQPGEACQQDLQVQLRDQRPADFDQPLEAPLVESRHVSARDCAHGGKRRSARQLNLYRHLLGAKRHGWLQIGIAERGEMRPQVSAGNLARRPPEWLGGRHRGLTPAAGSLCPQISGLGAGQKQAAQDRPGKGAGQRRRQPRRRSIPPRRQPAGQRGRPA